MWFLCKEIFKTTPDDPRIIDMDPVLRMWMYQNWVADQNDQAELAKNHAYLVASFWNPDAVQEILGKGNFHGSTDEEFDEASRMIREMNSKESEKEKSSEPIKRRARRSIVG